MQGRDTRGRTRGWVAGVVLVAGLGPALCANAQPVNMVAQRAVVVGDLEHGATWGDDSPYVFLGGFSDTAEAYLGGTHPYPGYPDFTTNELAVARQKSFVDPGTGQIAGTGEASIGFSLVDADLGYARSSLEVSFDLATPHTYQLTGLLEANTDGGLGVAALSLAGPTSFAFKKQGWGDGLALNQTGTLAAGSYHLSLYALMQPGCQPDDCSAYSWMGGQSRFAVDLRVAAVPEPATYALLLAGLGTLGFVGRRQGRRR